MVRRAGVSTPFWFFVSSETQMFAAGIFPSQVMTGQPGQHRRKRSWWRKTWIVQRCFSGNIRGKKLETWLQCSKHRWRYKECSQQGGNSFWWQFYADFARGATTTTSARPPNTCCCSLPFPLRSDSIFQCLVEQFLSFNVWSNIFPAGAMTCMPSKSLLHDGLSTMYAPLKHVRLLYPHPPHMHYAPPERPSTIPVFCHASFF